MRAAQVDPLFGVVAGVVGQCEHFACERVEHHNAAGLRPVGQHRIAQLLVSKELNLGIDAELNVFACFRLHGFTHLLHRASQAVFDHMAAACAPQQCAVEQELHTLLAVVFHIGKAHHMRGSLAFRVLAAVFGALVNALEIEFCNLLGVVGVDLTLEPNKAFILVGELFGQLSFGNAQQLRELLALAVFQRHILRNSPDAGRRHAGRQYQSIAIQNTAAIGWQLQRAVVAHLALVLEEVVVEDLDIGRARAQTHKTQGQRAHNKFAAPYRRAAGQQGAGGVLDAAAHGCFSGLSPLPRYSVMPGLTWRICSFSRATRSTRAGVAWLRLST